MLAIGMIFITGFVRGRYRLELPILAVVWPFLILHMLSFWSLAGSGPGRLRIFFGCILLFVVTSNLVWDVVSLRAIMKAVALLSGLFGAQVLILRLNPKLFPLPAGSRLGHVWYFDVGRGGFRFFGPYGYSYGGVLGTLLAMLWPVHFSYYVLGEGTSRRELRVLHLFISASLLYALIMNRGRGAWIAALVAVMVMVLERFHLRLPSRRVVMGLAAVTIIAAIVSGGSTQLSDVIADMLMFGSETGRVASRLDYWAYVTPQGLFNPLGLGGVNIQAHSAWLVPLLSFGLPGLLAWVAVVFFVLHRATRNIAQETDVERGKLLRVVRYGVIVWLIAGIFADQLYNLHPTAIFWLLAGILCSHSPSTEPRPSQKW